MVQNGVIFNLKKCLNNLVTYASPKTYSPIQLNSDHIDQFPNLADDVGHLNIFGNAYTSYRWLMNDLSLYGYDFLSYMLDKYPYILESRMTTIPKKDGSARVIHIPNPFLKEVQRLMSIAFNYVYLGVVYKDFLGDTVHGFVINRSPVTNALCHVNYKYTTMMDIKDFFPNVRFSEFYVEVLYFCMWMHLNTIDWIKFLKLINRFCFVNGNCAIGFPTSPVFANITFRKLDVDLIGRCNFNNWMYTRYADDFAISHNIITDKNLIKTEITNVLDHHPVFRINEKKTRTMAANSNRVITGIRVSDHIQARREVRRKIRAAIHQGNTHSENGLKEWCLLKTPNISDIARHFEKITKKVNDTAMAVSERVIGCEL